MNHHTFFVRISNVQLMLWRLYVWPQVKIALKLILPLWDPEAVVWRCSVEKLFLEISQNSQENTCDRASFLVKLHASDFFFFFFVFSISVNILIPIQTLANLFKFFYLNSSAYYFYRGPNFVWKINLASLKKVKLVAIFSQSC